jgi:hypothetical protein
MSHTEARCATVNFRLADHPSRTSILCFPQPRFWITSCLPTNRPQPGPTQLGKARTRKHGLVELPEFKQERAELFAEADYREKLAQIVH